MLCPPGTCGHSRLSNPYSTATYRLVPVSADLLGVCGRSDCHLRRAPRRMDGPQARAPLPPFWWRGSGSGPLADGTPPSPRNCSHVRRPHRLSVAGADVRSRAPAEPARRRPAAAPAATPAAAPRQPPAPRRHRARTAGRQSKRFKPTPPSGRSRSTTALVRAVFSNRGATLAAWELLSYHGPGRQARRSRPARRSAKSAEAVFAEARRRGEDRAPEHRAVHVRRAGGRRRFKPRREHRAGHAVVRISGRRRPARAQAVPHRAELLRRDGHGERDRRRASR